MDDFHLLYYFFRVPTRVWRTDEKGCRKFEKMLAFSPHLWYNSQADYFEFLTSLLGGASTMAKCECCGKGVTFGIKVSHSHRRSNRTWKPNVRRVKAVVEGSPKYIYACSRCLRAGKVTRAV
jgi:large subunit ribosomal protein L28